MERRGGEVVDDKVLKKGKGIPLLNLDREQDACHGDKLLGTGDGAEASGHLSEGRSARSAALLVGGGLDEALVRLAGTGQQIPDVVAEGDELDDGEATALLLARGLREQLLVERAVWHGDAGAVGGEDTPNEPEATFRDALFHWARKAQKVTGREKTRHLLPGPDSVGSRRERGIQGRKMRASAHREARRKASEAAARRAAARARARPQRAVSKPGRKGAGVIGGSKMVYCKGRGHAAPRGARA